ncbi:hypothetical protein R9C00_04220 [Flammeovirgaceae bacterium SG7u.111]|nr:hypothetical protein [Flammeovirgaceae bacterium SG7u.132]WPO36653.1 hypothetical protein R9C00_04220 [Flammeovirgaceae bacterium SG7u.111]
MGTNYQSYREAYFKIGWMNDKEKQLKNLQTFSLVLQKTKTEL